MLLEQTADPEQQQKIAARAKSVAEEAAKEKPDKEQLAFSANGLIEAAKFVKDLAGPLLATVTTLLSFFGLVL